MAGAGCHQYITMAGTDAKVAATQTEETHKLYAMSPSQNISCYTTTAAQLK
jgi:hypothetical protein